MPHCVLTLRLIGLTFDCYDGVRKKNVQLSEDQQKTALEEAPSLVEMLSQTFFIGGYLVGPQFSMKKFREFVKPEYHRDLPSPIAFGFKRLGMCWAYLSRFKIFTSTIIYILLQKSLVHYLLGLKLTNQRQISHFFLKLLF